MRNENKSNSLVSVKKNILNEEERWKILLDYEKLGKGDTLRMDIIDILQKKYKISKNTVYRIIQSYEENGSLKRKKGQGRKRKTNKREDRIIIKTIKKNKTSFQGEIVSELEKNYKIDISPRTLCRRAGEKDLKQKKIKITMSLTKKHIVERYNWCKEKENWPISEWMRLVFSDETRFYLLKDKGQTFVWQERKKCSKELYEAPPVTNIKGSVLFWGCISYLGIGLGILF